MSAALIITGSLSPDVTGEWSYIGDQSDRPSWGSLSGPMPWVYWSPPFGEAAGRWVIDTGGLAYWSAAADVPTPDLVPAEAWVQHGSATGVPTLALATEGVEGGGTGVEWTIVGEAGKAVDDTPRTLTELQAQGALLEYRSLAADTLTWTAWLRTRSQADALVPALGQTITLLRNGERAFTGHVTGRRIRNTAQGPAADITVSGPWWWLEQIPLSSEIPDQAGEAGERTAYVFATGSPRTHLMALCARAIELGAPISTGSIASVFAVPRLSLRNIPIAEAIAEVMRWVADGIVHFDYAAEGHPALCMQRRTPASIVTLNPANVVTPDINLRPRMDLQVEELAIYYARRETVGRRRVTVWDGDSAGTATSGLPKRQPVVVSGPEKVWDVLPQDFTDSVEVRSAVWADIVGKPVSALFVQYDDRLRAAGASNFQVGTFTESIAGGGSFTLPAVTTRITDRDGNPVDPAFTRYLTLGEVREWWTKDGIEHVNARITATIYNTVLSPAPIPGGYVPEAPAWFEAMGGRQFNYIVNSGEGTRRKDVFSTTVSVAVPLVKTAWDVPTLLIRAEDYAFVNPPAGLAANLLATQNWLPYEGEVSFITEEIPAGHHVGRTLNISGFAGETANMRALISAHSIRLATGQNTITLGAPERHAYRDLVNRFRQSGADNIVWLVESVSGDPGENPPPDPDLEDPLWPAAALLFDGDALTYDGDFVVWTAAEPIHFAGDELQYDGEALTYSAA